MRFATSAVMAALVLVGCASSTEGDVSEAEASSFLQSVTEAAQSGDAAAVCGYARSPSLCQSHLGATIPESDAPAESPEIECRSQTSDGTWIVVSGRTHSGGDYRSRLLLVEEAGDVVAQMPVFWDGVTTVPGDGDADVVRDRPLSDDYRCP